MDKNRIERLLTHATSEEKATVGTLYNATLTTLKSYQADSSTQRLRDWQATEEALSGMVKELEAKYFDKTNAFANISEAVTFLQSQGYKIKKTKAYEDAKKGLLIVQTDRSVLENDALAYAVRAGLDKTAKKPAVDDQVYAERAAQELELLKVRKEKLQFEHEKEMGLYLLKGDVQAELAMKLGAIEAGVQNMIAVNLVEWIESVGGNTAVVNDLQETIFSELDRLMNEFCSFDELQIVLKPANSEP